jgi:hypothetical protein
MRRPPPARWNGGGKASAAPCWLRASPRAAVCKGWGWRRQAGPASALNAAAAACGRTRAGSAVAIFHRDSSSLSVTACTFWNSRDDCAPFTGRGKPVHLWQRHSHARGNPLLTMPAQQSLSRGAVRLGAALAAAAGVASAAGAHWQPSETLKLPPAARCHWQLRKQPARSGVARSTTPYLAITLALPHCPLLLLAATAAYCATVTPLRPQAARPRAPPRACCPWRRRRTTHAR